MSHDESNHARPAPRPGRSASGARVIRGSNLAESLKLCESIDGLGLDGLSAAAIASALGYTNIKTNTFSARLSAARQFGLLSLTGDGYALSPLARAILHPVEPGRAAPALSPGAAQAAALCRAGRAAGRQAAARRGDPGQRALPQPPDHRLGQAGGRRGVPRIVAVRRRARRRPGLPPRRPPRAVAAPAARVAAGDRRHRPRSTPRRPAAPRERPRSSDVRLDLRLWDDDEGKTIRVRAPQSITAASFERFLQAFRLLVRIEE